MVILFFFYDNIMNILEKCNIVKNLLEVKIVFWGNRGNELKEQGIKWEDFVANIYIHIPGSKEQDFQNLLQDDNFFLNEDSLEENVQLDEYKECVKKRNKYGYPYISETNYILFCKGNRLFRKYHKRNMNTDEWTNFHEKILKGVSISTFEKIWKVEQPITEWLPVFIIDTNVDVEILGLCEKTIRQTFYYNVLIGSKSNRKFSDWLQDHHGNISESSTNISYKRWEECIGMFSQWDNTQWAILISGNFPLKASHFYYAMHVLRMRKEIDYITIRIKQYVTKLDYLISDTHPEKFETLQEVTSAFYGFCIVNTKYMNHNWNDQSFYDFCANIKGKKVVITL